MVPPRILLLTLRTLLMLSFRVVLADVSFSLALSLSLLADEPVKIPCTEMTFTFWSHTELAQAGRTGTSRRVYSTGSTPFIKGKPPVTPALRTLSRAPMTLLRPTQTIMNSDAPGKQCIIIVDIVEGSGNHLLRWEIQTPVQRTPPWTLRKDQDRFEVRHATD